ncbi:MAG: hypothetical protein EA416_00545 [Trueperaceae bacterium]|nr:MAG: hypothetical protein EA416_00545 [Trueperaceae bacterium]
MSLLGRWARRYKRRSRVVPIVLRRIDPTAGDAEYLHWAYRTHRAELLAPYQVDDPKGAMQRQYSVYQGARRWSAWYLEDVFAAAVRLVGANGAYVRRLTGKAKVRQAIEMLSLASWLPSMPEQYYRFEWYLPEFRGRARQYLHRHEVKYVLYRMLGDQRGPASVSNKARFHAHALAHGLPVVPLVALVRGGRVALEPGVDLDALDVDLFVKPIAGKGGRGADRLTALPGQPGRFRSAATRKRHTLAQLLERYAARSRKAKHADGFLVQHRAVNHRDLRPLAGEAAATVRVVTILDERGAPEPVAAILRMPGRLDGVVDNFHAGGIAAPVALDDGTLGEASSLGIDGDLERLRVRPDSGAPIAGSPMPLWDDVLRLCLRAHRAFAPRVLVGWDVCVTDDGPVLIEANGQPCTDFMQRVQRAPLGDARFGQLLAHHVRATLAERT